VFDKSAIRSRSLYGCVSQEDMGDRIRAEFMVDSIGYMANWLLMFGSKVTVESPEELKLKLVEITEDLYQHYSKTELEQSVSVSK
jgi:predicted DNA-binding transcriptional regulator YafY